MAKKTSILVTGGAGFIGSHITDRLVLLGYKVTVFDNLSTGEKRFLNPKAKFVKGDVSDRSDVAKLFKQKFNTVLHIAGCASSIKSFSEPRVDIETNFLGTANIVEKCLQNKITRFLYASSMTVYGKVDEIPVQEDFSYKPISYYGISKYASERFVHATSERIDLDFPFHATSFRMFNVYGPRQSLTNPYQGVMAIFIGNVLRKEEIKIFGNGKQSRDFIYIDDVVDVWTKSIENKETFGKVFNLGFGIDISVNKLTRTIINTLNYDSKKYPIIYEKARPGDQKHMRANISSLKKALNWKPKIDLEKGLELTIKWAQKENKN